MNVKIIKSEAEYEEAMEKMSELMNKELQPGSEEDELFDLLALVIQDYEQKHASPLELDPIEGIKFRMDQMGLSKKDLVPYLGSMSRVSEVLSRKRSLSLSMIQKLHEGLGIPLERLIQRKPCRPSRSQPTRTHRKRAVKRKKVKLSKSRKKGKRLA